MGGSAALSRFNPSKITLAVVHGTSRAGIVDVRLGQRMMSERSDFENEGHANWVGAMDLSESLGGASASPRLTAIGLVVFLKKTTSSRSSSLGKWTFLWSEGVLGADFERPAGPVANGVGRNEPLSEGLSGVPLALRMVGDTEGEPGLEAAGDALVVVRRERSGFEDSF